MSKGCYEHRFFAIRGCPDCDKLNPKPVIVGADKAIRLNGCYPKSNCKAERDLKDRIKQLEQRNKELELENKALKTQLNDLLNDCINFDGGKLTDSILKVSSDLLKRLTPPNKEEG